MKKQTTSIAIASIFAVTALFASAATYQNTDQGYHPSYGEGNVAFHNFDTDQGYHPSYDEGNNV